MTKKYDVCVIGLGPVGAVSGLCFAKQGLRVIGVDIDQRRVDALNNGGAPFIEPGIEECSKSAREDGTFRATLAMEEAVQNAPVIMIAVGTPTPQNVPDLTQLDKVCAQIGIAISNKTTPTVIAVRSTVPPGTIRQRLTPIIEAVSGKRAGMDFHMVSNPEFLREGSAIHDFFHTSRVIVGADSDAAAECIESLYAGVEADEMLRVSIESAEFAKYVDNSWHALKVSFSNEIGRICQAAGGKIEETTRIFLADKRLNISECYLKPGFAFGGSCLPKDVRGLAYLAATKGVDTPVIDAILPSNEAHIALGVEAIREYYPTCVGLLGVAFKEHVDDLRESPSLIIANELIKCGIGVKACDPCYPPGQTLILPRSGKALELMSPEALETSCDVLVLMHRLPSHHTLAAQFSKTGRPVVDLTTLPKMPAPFKQAALQAG